MEKGNIIFNYFVPGNIFSNKETIMSTASRVIKNTGFLYARMIATLLVSLWTTRVILNALGDINFGIYNVVGGTINTTILERR